MHFNATMPTSPKGSGRIDGCYVGANPSRLASLATFAAACALMWVHTTNGGGPGPCIPWAVEMGNSWAWEIHSVIWIERFCNV